MYRIVRTGLLMVLPMFFIGLVAAGTANAQGVVGEVLKRMEVHYQGLTSLKATVKMDKFNAQLGDHDLYEGSLIFIPQKGRDAAFRIDWTKPANESLAVINKQYVMYRPNLQTAYTGSVNSATGSGKSSGALAFLNMSKAQLKANYEINYVGQESVSGGTQTWHLQLVPRSAASYKNADIWVNADGMPVQMKQTENNNDTTTVLLSGLNKNTKINAKDVQISPPKGTKITKS